MKSVFERLMKTKAERGAGFFLLLDPDRMAQKDIITLTEAAGDCEVDALLVGTSLMLCTNFHRIVREIKIHSSIPVIIFPGSHAQIAPDADAILFTSLISGRNPQYLIDEQVKGAPIIKEYGLEPIPTGYMLIESGRYTSVQHISQTFPIPSDKADIACAHALAAQYFGMKLVFLEAGSGTVESVPVKMIKAVAEYTTIPIMVGGGIRRPEEAESKVVAGASFVVIGSQFEKNNDSNLLREFAAALHTEERVGI
jgi:phosphoglycerol geranylgeranyltransferase